MTIEIPREEEERRLRVLLGPGTAPGWPRRRADRMILLRRAAAELAPGASLGERAFTELLTAWLAGEAKELHVDAAELRRALVDEGFVERDRAGSAYRRSARHASRVRFASDTPSGASPEGV
jgi:hypothetical protein